jgi:hypothetical protein
MKYHKASIVRTLRYIAREAGVTDIDGHPNPMSLIGAIVAACQENREHIRRLQEANLAIMTQEAQFMELYDAAPSETL